MNTQWRRWRRGLVERPRRHSPDASLTGVVLTLVAGALVTLVTGLWIIQAVEQFGPSVGGIIVFKPDTAATERWSVTADVVEATSRGVPAASDRRCVLSPRVMAERGGSLVIEARRLTRPPVFRVHWAGGRTDSGSGDCGGTSDLVLRRTDLMRLANVAGGLNSGLRLIGP